MTGLSQDLSLQLLHHHGDVEGRGMLDLAVNVALTQPPEFLRAALTAALPDVASYPHAAPATARLADHLGAPPERVLLTNGAAEAFHLLSRAHRWKHPVIVHPQFTEPETALRAAGFTPARHVLPPPFSFDADAFEADHADADLVVIGNPTNPTSRLHSAADLLRLRRPGRLVVIDEAFMDVVPREQNTLLRHAAVGEGVLVIRSLTKTFGLAGIRAGFVLGDPGWVAACAATQPHWSVNSLALAATVAVCSEQGVAHTQAMGEQIARQRRGLVQTLGEVGLEVVQPAAAPFVLARHPRAATWRVGLREKGIAVRRADTFPGLDDSWIRIAVRDAATTDILVTALRDLQTTSPLDIPEGEER